MHWASGLSGTRPRGVEIEWLGPDADRIRTAWGPGAVTWAAEVGEEVIAKAGEKLPLLGGSGSVVDALRRGTTSTTLRVLAIVSGCAEPDMPVVSPEAAEASRDLARRGPTLAEFTRAIRFGHSVLTTAFIDAIAATAPPSQAPAELRRVSLLLFKLIDEFIADVADVFVDEQTAWAASRSAAQLELVRKIVEGDSSGLADAERVLGYSLSGQHLGIIVWSAPSGERTAHRLRAVIDPVLRCWGTPQASLVIPVGSNTLWAWGSFSSNACRETGGRLPEFDTTYIVTGQIGTGVEGFRQTHLEARSVERLVRQGSDLPRASMAHEDVDLDVLLLADRQAARQFVARHLGPLASDDPRMKELRTTLRRYLEMRRSLAKVAAVEHISRNTVTYRVQQAFALCGHPSDTSTTKLHAALLAADWLHESPDSAAHRLLTSAGATRRAV